MISKKIFFSIIAFLVLVSIQAQIVKANRLFQKRDFLNASEIYEKALEKENSKNLLEKLTVCYYSLNDYNRGIQVMKNLIDGNFVEDDKRINLEYNFMFYHFLLAAGDYEKAIDEMIIYKKKLGLIPPDRIDSKEIVETFKLKKPDFKVDKVSFNSEGSDYSAIKKNDSIFFTSDREGKLFSKKYKWTHRPFLNLYVLVLDSTKNESGEILALPELINSPLHEGTTSFSKDGKTMYFSRSNQVDGKKIFSLNGDNKIQLYVSKKINGEWSMPVKLSFCSDEYNYQHPALSPDGRILYYATDELGSIGGFDIYKVDINEDGTYGSPMNLGGLINTYNREQFPFVTENGDLFFSSNGHLGLGLLDIFASKYENGRFGEPINLGSPINSQYDDFSLTYSDDNNTGFFSSNRDKVNDDIFSFVQTDNIFEREYINTFTIKDSINRNSVSDAVVVLQNENQDIIYQNTLDSTAQFNLNLIPGNYKLIVEAFGYETKNNDITITDKNKDEHIVLVKKLFDLSSMVNNDSDKSKEVLQELLDDESDPKIRIENENLYFDMPNIYFDFDRWEIREDSKIVLNELIKKLNKYRSLAIRIDAYTDNRGTDGYNQVLSEKRAQSTTDYIIKFGGLDISRIRFKGHGESKPLIDCSNDCTEEMHQKNRRSEFMITSY